MGAKTLDQKVGEMLQLCRGEFANSYDLEALKSARTCLEREGLAWTPELASVMRRVLGVPRQPDYPEEVRPYVQQLHARIDQGDSAAYSELSRLATLHVSTEY